MKNSLVLLLLSVLAGACAGLPPAPVEERATPETTREASPVTQPGPVYDEPVDTPLPPDMPPPPIPLPRPVPVPLPAPAAGPGWRTVPQEATSISPPFTAETERPAADISDNPAVVALLDDTGRKVEQGDSDAAIRSLERAVRLEPRNPWLWRRLAVLQFKLQQWNQAIALANKSSSLADKWPQLRQANTELTRLAKQALQASGSR